MKRGQQFLTFHLRQRHWRWNHGVWGLPAYRAYKKTRSLDATIIDIGILRPEGRNFIFLPISRTKTVPAFDTDINCSIKNRLGLFWVWGGSDIDTSWGGPDQGHPDRPPTKWASKPKAALIFSNIGKASWNSEASFSNLIVSVPNHKQAHDAWQLL